MHTSARFPAYDIPRAASMAVFSLQHHLLWIFRPRAVGLFWIYSVISVEGVPGYAYTPESPAWMAPKAMASSPNSNRFSVILYYEFMILYDDMLIDFRL